MEFESDDELIVAASLEELAGGPLPIIELAARLGRRGVTEGLTHVDDEELLQELDEILLSSDDVWMSDDGIVASTALLLEGLCFTHRVTGSELIRDVLDASPDFTVLDFDVSDGLAFSGGGKLHYTIGSEDELALSDNDSFAGPPGWLGAVKEFDTVVLSRTGRTVSLAVVREPDRGDAEEEALRGAFTDLYEPGIAVEATDLLLNALCRNPHLFRQPVIPLVELLERADLECRGEWIGRRGEKARPPGVVARERLITTLGQEYGFDRCCTRAFAVVLDEWSQFILRRVGPDDSHQLARAAAHSMVAPAFAQYALRGYEGGSQSLDEFAKHIIAAKGKLCAAGNFLRALNFEHAGDAGEAEEELRRALRADVNYGPALEELAWYVADHGNAAQAISLRQRAPGHEGDPELAYLLTRVSKKFDGVGRNDPCPCGSGRKFKSCCVAGAKESIEQRAEWLYHKVVVYSLRAPNRWGLEELFEVALEASGGDATNLPMATLGDLAAFSPGFVGQFIEARGNLLPEDELALAREWVSSQPSLWQVVGVEPGSSIDVFDTRTGEKVTVTERTASMSTHVGDYVFARVLLAGSQHQFMGQPISVPMAHRASLLTLLDDGADSLELAWWVGRLYAPISMVNYEGDPTVLCRAVLRSLSTPWDEISGTLNRTFERTAEGRWTELVEIKGESVARCFLERELDTLVVTTNSIERFDRILNVLHEVIGDVEILEETRSDVASLRDEATRAKGPVARANDELSDEALQMVRELMHEKETGWLDESVPALGGLTPRQASEDPTRREDLIALLNEFDRHNGLPSGAVTFNVARLREQLGLAP